MPRKSKRVCGISARHFRRLVAKELIITSDNPDTNSKFCLNNEKCENAIVENNKNIQKNMECTSYNFEQVESAEEERIEEYTSSEESDTITNEETVLKKDNKLCKNLKMWSKEYNISHVALNGLLDILNKTRLSVPRSAKTLHETSRQPVSLKNVYPGEYLHLGLEYMLKRKFKNEHLPQNIVLNVNIDGLPLSKSSGLCLWPILVMISNIQRCQPFFVGGYAGYKKPEDANEFLREFAEEYKTITENGIIIEDKKVEVAIQAFCCDAPARAFISGIKGHTSFHGCSKCAQIGSYRNRKVLFAPSCGKKFTDEDYCQRLFKKQFTDNNVSQKNILEFVGIKMVSQIPIEPMHLLDIGITKKVLNCILKGTVKGHRIQQREKNHASQKLLSLVSYIPEEFCRKPRDFDELPRWKSSEFRQFALYAGILILKDLIDEDAYYHFLLFHCAYRLLACPDNSIENADCANAMLEEFVKYFGLIYGEEQLTYNVHSLLHISDCVKQFGSVDKFSAYPFENYMQTLKKQVRRPNKVLQQLYNRIHEEEYVFNKTVQHGIRKLLAVSENEKIYKEYRTQDFVLRSSIPDDCCCIEAERENIPVKVISIKIVDRYEILESRKFIKVSPFFLAPMNSTDIGVIKAEGLSDTVETFNLSKVLYKYVRLPSEEYNLLIPLLHLWRHQI